MARADESEHIRDLSGGFERFRVFGLVFGDGPAEDFGEVFIGGLMPLFFGIEQRPDFAEFAGIEPESCTAGAFINEDLFFCAEKVSHHYEVFAFGAVKSFLRVDFDAVVFWGVEQCLAGGLVRLIEFFQFEIVEPDSTAATFADIDGNILESFLLELI